MMCLFFSYITFDDGASLLSGNDFSFVLVYFASLLSACFFICLACFDAEATCV